MNAFYNKTRLTQGLLPDLELFKKMFPSILDINNANKKQKKIFFKIIGKIEWPILTLIFLFCICFGVNAFCHYFKRIWMCFKAISNHWKKNVLRISLKRCKSMYKVIFLEEYHTRSGDGGWYREGGETEIGN